MMQSAQTIVATAFCTLGAIVLVVANGQKKQRDITKIRLVSPEAKIVSGLFLILAGCLAFLSQFLPPR